jgi:hypothetical protein
MKILNYTIVFTIGLYIGQKYHIKTKKIFDDNIKIIKKIFDDNKKN